MSNTNVIEFDVTVPDWLEDVINGMQENEDRSYTNRLRLWNQNNASWLQNAQIAVTIGQEVPKPPAIPTKEIFGVKDGLIVQYTYQDPAPHPPTFAPVAVTPAGTFSSAAPAKDAQNDAILKAILQAVLSIKATLKA